ncbi:uncharacterized protein CFAP97D2 [Antechinus flavipes]|uniref:uncharacterized protein CFAP97D2 n=1 Tax=Antechinus flavipes TaxID=38775 RepID=UPI002235D689|nr:uncharacterized protein CFAP97D2 [Antechinus flavipes]
MKFCVKVTPLSEEGKGPIKRFKMHRPCCPLFNYFDNIICQKSWERAYRDHRRKVETAKATVDCGPPVIYNHVQLNLKKFKKDAERLRFIDRENRWLMERIAFIMRTQDACDILNDYRLRWWDRRERELRRIDRENRSFQERLVSCLHWYHFHRWWEDWQLEDSFSDTLTEIPQTCCCSHLVHEIRPRRMTPRKRLLKLRQRRVETWDSDVEDEAISEDCKMKKGSLDDNLMEEKAKKFSTKDEEELINKALKGQEKRKYEINQEEMDELGSRLLQDVKLRVAKLEIELETESRMLQEVKTMILLKEQEEAGLLRKRDSKSRKSLLKEKDDAKEDGKEEDGESKPTEGGDPKSEDADAKTEGAESEGAVPNVAEGGDSNPTEGGDSAEGAESKGEGGESGEGGEPKPMERTDPKPMERTDSKSMSEPKPMERTDSKSMSDPKPMERTDSKSMSDPKPMERTESKSMSEPKPMERTESKSMSEPKPMERTESKSMSDPKPMERTESKLMDRGEEREVPKPREREPKPREREMREPKPREREESETRRVTLVEPGKEGDPERDESSVKLSSEGEENASLDRTASQPPESSQDEPQDTS